MDNKADLIEEWRFWTDNTRYRRDKTILNGGYYEVSNLGRIRKNGKIITIKPHPKGYIYLNSKWIHRLVWELFIGPIPDGYEIDHINTIRDDNRLCNLRCVTRTQNYNNPITLDKHKISQNGHTTKNKHRQYRVDGTWKMI